jgi:hypothetical protein
LVGILKEYDRVGEYEGDLSPIGQRAYILFSQRECKKKTDKYRLTCAVLKGKLANGCLWDAINDIAIWMSNRTTVLCERLVAIAECKFLDGWR